MQTGRYPVKGGKEVGNVFRGYLGCWPMAMPGVYSPASIPQRLFPSVFSTVQSSAEASAAEIFSHIAIGPSVLLMNTSAALASAGISYQSIDNSCVTRHARSELQTQDEPGTWRLQNVGFLGRNVGSVSGLSSRRELPRI